MARRVAAVVLVLTLTPAVVYAQDATLTVTAASADVYKGPSNVTPVIGHVSRGAALAVSRNLGSWVRIPWPSAPDGVGYVHVTMGRLSAGAPEPTAAPTPSTSVSSPKPAATTTPAPVPAPPPARTPARAGVGVQEAHGVTSISHVIGVGGLVQSAHGFGAAGRAWHADRFGLDLRLTRTAMTSDAGRVIAVEFEPRFVFALFDHVSDYVWVRPYVGSGLTFSHRTLTNSPATAGSTTDDRMGFGVFGGGELTFAGVTPFGLSAEFGYRPPAAPFPGYETDRFTLSIAGHWYIK